MTLCCKRHFLSGVIRKKNNGSGEQMTGSAKNTLAIQALGFYPQNNRGIALLEAITVSGSINGAAQQLEMSYKAAWEHVEKLNNHAETPLLKRSVGGRGGGGTKLTAAGARLIRDYHRLEREYRKFIAFINADMADAAEFSRILRRMEMKISARNVWNGKIIDLSDGTVNALVSMQLPGGDRLYASVTRESIENLGLAVDTEVLALVKSSAVMVARELDAEKVSARNVLSGVVERLVAGPVTAEVTIALPGGATVTATVTGESAECLGLRAGVPASALIKASSVLLAVV